MMKPWTESIMQHLRSCILTLCMRDYTLRPPPPKFNVDMCCCSRCRFRRIRDFRTPYPNGIKYCNTRPCTLSSSTRNIELQECGENVLEHMHIVLAHMCLRHSCNISSTNRCAAPIFFVCVAAASSVKPMLYLDSRYLIFNQISC